MAKAVLNYLISLTVFSGVLFGVHYYILFQFFDGELYFPLWAIYVFNAVLVLIVFSIIRYKGQAKSDKIYQMFLGLTFAKMVLAVVFLLPIFLGKSDHAQLEVINFFIPYFLFLAFEIFSLNRFLQKS